MKKLLSFYTVSLFFICLFHFTANVIWTSLNTAPLPWDQAGHTRLVLEFVNYFKSYDLLKIVNYFSVSSYYPPLIHTIAAFFVIIFGHPIFISAFVINLFFVSSIVLVYLLMNDLFKERSIALLSAVIYSFFPIIFEHSRWFLLEIPLLSFVLASFLFLYRSRNLTDRKNTILFFIFAALSLMTKWLALIYLFIPVFISLYNFVKIQGEERIKALSAIKNGLFIFFGLTLPWYLVNLDAFLKQIPANLKGESSDPQNLLTLANWGFYLYLFTNFQVTIYLAFLFFTGAIFYLLTKNRNKLFIFGYIIFIYLFFTFVSNKDWRYTIPILPFIALIIAYFLLKIKKFSKPLGLFLILIILLLQITYFMLLSFRSSFNIKYQRAVNLPLIGWVDYVNLNDNLAHSFSNNIWPQKEILEGINIQSPDGALVLCLIDQERFNAGNLLLERDLLKLGEIEIENPPTDLFSEKYMLEAYLSRFQYALVAEKTLGNPATRNIAVFEQFKKHIQSKKEPVVRSFNLPNGEILVLYKIMK